MGGMSNGWDHKGRNHGAFEIQQLTWAFRHLAAETDDPVVRKNAETGNGSQMAYANAHTSWTESAFRPHRNFEDYILEMMTHSNYDEYWQHLDLNWVEYYDQTADIPMLLISGWYDSYAGGTIDNYNALSSRLDSPVYLIMGPWTHSGNTRS